MAQKIEGAQRDFSFGEVDIGLKRADDHPARKGGLRQMANARILNTGAIQDRPGRRAIFPSADNTKRTERFTIAAGVDYYIAFAPGHLKIKSLSGVTLFDFTTLPSGAAVPWVTVADINSIVYTIFNKTITICFGHAMRPHLLTWNGASTWTLSEFVELSNGFQKRTLFYRVSPQGITLLPSGQTGAITLTASVPLFVPAHVGTYVRYIGRQILITGYVSPTVVNASVQESLPGTQVIGFSATDPTTFYTIGDVVIGSVTNSKGLVIAINPAGNITVQLLTVGTTTVVAGTGSFFDPQTVTVSAFVSPERVVGPSGSITASSTTTPIGTPAAVSLWDDEVMNALQGWPASCFTDQFRVGFCNFQSVPGGIGWSAINTPNDLYVGASPADAMFELAPAKVQVYYVVPGPESSEFIFCDRRIYYIPISATNPLRPGSVAFQILSGDGAAQVQPRLAQESILYVNSGQNSVMAVIATGAYQRPFNTKNLTDYHAHLFTGIVALAAPNADGTFNERYAYVLNADGSLIVGKYNSDSLATNAPVIGWGPWSGGGSVTWISALAAEVLFTSSYFGSVVCEVLDDTQYLDCALAVNAAPASFAPPLGKGPLWFIPSQSVMLMDQVTRAMGIYQIDANGFIVPQGNGGENLAALDLIAGQPWTMITEPFCPNAAPGNDVGQRMTRRRISRFATYVVHSTGFLMARLFAGPPTPTSPALGTVMNFTRFPAWNQGDDVTKPPPQRETAERTRPIGRAFDPRVAIIKDTPGPLMIEEIGIEASL